MEDSMDLVNRPSSQQGNKYEVFLSFSRGEDTDEDSFASHLYSSLRKAGIPILKDDIPIELLRSFIEGSEISIIIFSKHYASSERCLEELAKIVESRRAHDQVVLPIFYGVDPSEVRNKTSSFGEAFQGLIQRISPTDNEVSRWCTALSEAGGNYGFFVPNSKSKNESTVIQNIVERVRHILDRKGPFATEGLVGVSSQVQAVITMLLNHHSKDLLSIGIWGMGGMGKTTIAKIIFHHIQYEFESTYFLSNVREVWEGPWHNKVLLVLDDVNLFDQLDALCRHRDWFGRGSRIIITTRDLHILRAFGVDLVYIMKPLGHHESLELFCRKAFKQASLEGEFTELSRRVLAYTEGLPLALKVLGSSLLGRSVIECESALMKLSTIPSNLYDALKPSFDSLDVNEKEIFLNIVLFHIGEDINDAIQNLDHHGCNASIGIRALVDRSLVTIDQNNKLRMHNMLQLMGRQIICESSQNELLKRGHRYEVFLSFRGEDTRITFTSHLYTALCNAGIIVFKDAVELPRGNHIKKKLLQAIGTSKVLIIIFSKEYAGSKWCLEELSIIMELHKLNHQVLLPVFYDVDPLEVRHQSSSFGEAFRDLIKRISPPEDQVSKWRKALGEAGGTAGVVILSSREKSENVKVVVENVCDMLDKKDLFVAEHPVGVDDRVQEVIAMLHNHQSKDVIMVGIWGMGGVGKTTVAKAIYNEIGRKFDSRSYLPKIREVWDHEKGQVSLQNQLLFEICRIKKMKINNIESGKIILSDRLRYRKALVVLDDVDKLAQLNALVGSRDWFKPGSKIIITTRNKRLLHKMDCSVYVMKNLDERESIKLLSWHAFKQANPKEDFIELSRSIVACSGGLPLALEVLGSYLFDKEVKEWKRALKKLKKIPNDKIQKKLKISFDGLDDSEKKIFLDISCFFIGMDRNDVTQILNGCEYFADIGIKTLLERSLVTIDVMNKLGMHDLLRDLGREMIREQSENELGKRSRLWSHEDVVAVLLKHMGTKSIEGLSLKLSQGEKMHFQTEAFKKMKRLRLLRLDNVRLTGDYKYINKNLIWVCWHGFPIKYIPSNLNQQKLVAIDLKYSSLRQVWKEPQLLDRLKILNLSHSPYLVQTPDFSKLPNLEKLILKDCPSLPAIHHSIGLLDKLLLLDLEDCIGLHSLPRSTYRLRCLKSLILSGCVMIEKLEEDIEQMESLTTLIAPTIKQVPFSLLRLKSILYLSICGYEGLSHHVIPCLFRSWTSRTNNPPPLIPAHAGMPSSIFWDRLNNIHGPSTISSSEPKQHSLLLGDGLEVPYSLCSLDKDTLRLENCLEHLLINIGKNSQVVRTLSELVSQGLNRAKYSDDACILPDDNYPYWLTFKGEGASVKFEVPQVNGCDHLKGMTFCCVYCPIGDVGNKACESCISSLMILNYTKSTTLLYKDDKIALLEAEWKKIISTLEPDDQVEVKVEFVNELTVKETVAYLIYNESFDEQMELSTFEAINLTGTKHKCDEEGIEQRGSRNDLLLDMGGEIIRKQSQNELGKRSGLWFDEYVFDVLLKQKGIEGTEGMSLKMSESGKTFIGDLRWLCWHGFPQKYIPRNFNPEKLVAFVLQNSNLKQLWNGPLELERMKILNLSYSRCSVQIPDFSKLPNLEKLILKCCSNLSMMHRSIGPSAIPRSLLKQRSQYGLEILDSLYATDCMGISRLENSLAHLLIQIGKNSQVFYTLSEKVSQGLNLTKYSDDCILPGDNYPYWLTFKGEGASMKFKVPPLNVCEHLKGMTICCVYFASRDLGNKACESCIMRLIIINYTKTATLLYDEDKLASLEEADKKEIISNLEPDDQVEVIVVLGNGFIAKETAVYLIYNESFDEQIELLASEATGLSGTKRKCEEEEEETHHSTRPEKTMKI